MDLHPDWSEFLRLLNSHKVEFLIVGAHALAFHGHPRMTGDLDCFVGSSSSNVERLYLALTEFGFGDQLPSLTEFQNSHKILMMGRLPMRIDVLNHIDGITFEDAWQNRVEGTLGDVPAFFISQEDFLRNKRASGRIKDQADVEALESQDC